MAELRRLPASAPVDQVVGVLAVHDALALNGGYLGMVSLRDPLELLDEGLLGGGWEALTRGDTRPA